jgi:hypothetical protein
VVSIKSITIQDDDLKALAQSGCKTPSSRRIMIQTQITRKRRLILVRKGTIRHVTGEELSPIVRRTLLPPCAFEQSEISAKRLFLKLEDFQPIGAYKLRTASTMSAALTPE